MPLDLRRLEHFLAIVEHQGVTPAAERLHLSQQALSGSLAQLERQLGTALFDRSRGRLRPTAAGQALAAAGPGVLRAAVDAEASVARAGQGTRMPLRIGRSPAVTGERAAELLEVAATEEALTGMAIEVSQHFPAQLEENLRNGTIDLALVRHDPQIAAFGARTIAFDRLRVAVVGGHRWAARDSLALTELARTPIVVWGESGRSGYTDFLAGICRAAGFEPRLRRTSQQGLPPAMAAEGEGVALVTEHAGPSPDGRVIVVELTPPTFVPLQALWMGPAPSAPVARLLDLWSADPADAAVDTEGRDD